MTSCVCEVRSVVHGEKIPTYERVISFNRAKSELPVGVSSLPYDLSRATSVVFVKVRRLLICSILVSVDLDETREAPANNWLL